MVRSMLLRGFDRECVDKIDLYMQKACGFFVDPGVCADGCDLPEAMVSNTSTTFNVRLHDLVGLLGWAAVRVESCAEPQGPTCARFPSHHFSIAEL